ncbi:hypothetical protein [Terrabacter sp. Root181]|uniref:hypothetical protein n=1 Tax=Terrabacter sp. Root181 TaxID=1736484 RepID=UPI000B31DF73|nr:hypothetical protein [Terrabacter sp. Root181]
MSQNQPPVVQDNRRFGSRLADRVFRPRYAGRSALTAISLAMFVGIVSVVAIAFVLTWMNSQNFIPAEIAIALVVILGALVLVLCVACLSIVLKRLALADKRYAMGLPDGSIRAILALMLVLLFGVVSVFLVGSAQRGGFEGRKLDNLSTAQVDAIPVDQVLSKVETSDGSGLYDVVLVAAPNESFDDLSKQLLTTLATLVVAIAAFYFGASTVTNAVETVNPRRPAADDGEGEEITAEEAAKRAEAEKAKAAEAAKQAEVDKAKAAEAAEKAQAEEAAKQAEAEKAQAEEAARKADADTAQTEGAAKTPGAEVPLVSDPFVGTSETAAPVAFPDTEAAARLARSTQAFKAVEAMAVAAQAALAELSRVRVETTEAAGDAATGTAATVTGDAAPSQVGLETGDDEAQQPNGRNTEADANRESAAGPGTDEHGGENATPASSTTSRESTPDTATTEDAPAPEPSTQEPPPAAVAEDEGEADSSGEGPDESVGR